MVPNSQYHSKHLAAFIGSIEWHNSGTALIDLTLIGTLFAQALKTIAIFDADTDCRWKTGAKKDYCLKKVEP